MGPPVLSSFRRALSSGEEAGLRSEEPRLVGLGPTAVRVSLNGQGPAGGATRERMELPATVSAGERPEPSSKCKGGMEGGACSWRREGGRAWLKKGSAQSQQKLLRDCKPAKFLGIGGVKRREKKPEL